MKGKMKLLLGCGVFGVVGLFFFLLASFEPPSGSGPLNGQAAHVPQPEKLGGVVPKEPAPSFQEKRETERPRAAAEAPSIFMPPAAELERIEREKSVVY